MHKAFHTHPDKSTSLDPSQLALPKPVLLISHAGLELPMAKLQETSKRDPYHWNKDVS
jgi:hypothetical protein